MSMHARSRAAMTLMEVLAVVVILSLLAVTLVVALGGKMAAAKHGIAKIRLAEIRKGLETYQSLQGRYPDGLDVLATPNLAYSVEPANLKDPWDRKWQLLVPGPLGQPYELLSLGADGQRGGEGENADISSAQLGQTETP
jgi:general secretion pathway protein G